MKKALPGLFFFVAFTSVSIAQKAPFTTQEFALKELTLKESTTPFNQRLVFNFKIFGKYSQDQIEPEAGKHNASYKLKFWLTDAKGDTLVSPNMHKSLLQSFSFFNIDSARYKSYSFGHSIEIPYQLFRVTGTQTITLWAQPQNSDGTILLKPFKVNTYKANIPSLYSLEKQNIRIPSSSILYNNKKYSDKGLTIVFSPQFQYSANELYSEKETLDEVIFYAELTTTDGSPATMPYGSPSLKSNTNPYTTEHRKNTLKSAEIFIPYINLFLPEGLHEINYSIHAISKNQSKRWDNLSQGKLHLQMPRVYFAKVVVKNIRVTDKSYDVAAKNIPFANIFVSSKSTSGKGYPDLFWTLGNEYQNFISTPIVQNTFTAPNDSCSFQMINGDVIKLGVYDYDTFSFNDEIGSFNFLMKNEQTTLSQKNLKSGDVLNGEILIQRKPRPNIPNIALHVKNILYGGITGYQIWGNITRSNPDVLTKIYIKLMDGTNQILTWKAMSDIPSGANFSYFIPAWDLPQGASFGLAAIDSYFFLPLAQKVANPEKYITETNDVKLNIKPLQLTIQNGVNGVLLNIDVQYPEGLANKNKCHFKYQFKESSGTDLKKITDVLKISGKPVCETNDCNMQVFIPFYLLQQFSGKQISTLFQGEITINDDFSIGKNSVTLTIQVPNIVKFPKTQLSMNLKMPKNWTYVSISTEYNGISKVFVKENSQGGSIVTDVIFPTEFAGEDDQISILITPYEFRTALKPIEWHFTTTELLKNKVILPNSKYIKKAKLITN